MHRAVDVIYTPEDREAEIPARERATAATRGHSSDERWHLRKDGSRFFASGVMSPIRDADGNVCGFTKVWRDMTESTPGRGGRPRGRRPPQGDRGYGR